MSFVLDASVTVSWGLEDEDNPLAGRVLHRLGSEAAVVPVIWWFEIRNVLLISERRARISERDATTFIKSLAAINIVIDPASPSDAIVVLARRHTLTVYDASYLELAMREGVPLATLDKRLAAAAEAEGVPLIG